MCRSVTLNYCLAHHVRTNLVGTGVPDGPRAKDMLEHVLNVKNIVVPCLCKHISRTWTAEDVGPYKIDAPPQYIAKQ